MTHAAMICSSHVAIPNLPGAAPADVKQELGMVNDSLRSLVSKLQPELVVQFGSDHNSSFNYSVMPPFCVGMRARCLGDFMTSSGQMQTDEAISIMLLESLHEQGIDVAGSYDMLVDHGFTQLLDILFGAPDTIPVIPVYINCGSDFRPPMKRVLALGQAVGRFLYSIKDKRVLVLGTGGLSHDPPIPAFRTASADVQAILINGINYTPDKLSARNKRVADAAKDFATGNQGGYKELNEEWDRELLKLLETGRFMELAGFCDDWIYEMGGCGGQEIRMWLAACAAFSILCGNDNFKAVVDYYRSAPEIFVGYGVVHTPITAIVM